MPFKSQSIKLQGLQDRRKKLTDEQRITIREMYSTGKWSLNQLAQKFFVSKKTILLIVNPSSAERAREYSRENWKEFQAPKEKRTIATREHRRYKQDLYVRGKLHSVEISE